MLKSKRYIDFTRKAPADSPGLFFVIKLVIKREILVKIHYFNNILLFHLGKYTPMIVPI
ncbi:hypothetical protein EMIT074MI3_12427 [Bacillus licheniformis]|jgi:hypothetical protein